MMNRYENENRTEIRRRTYLLAGLVGGVAIASVAILNLDNAPNKHPIDALRDRAEFSVEPAWTQDFAATKDTRLDTGIWHYETDYRVPGYNNEKQAYTSQNKNVRIEPGVGLVIEAHRADYTYPDDPDKQSFDYTSGRIDTRGAFTFEYGKVEARMKLPEGAGTWPAFWLLSDNEIHTNALAAPSDDPRAYMQNGEVDVMEHYGHSPGIVEGTVHTYAQSSANEITIPDASKAFHTYGIEISRDSITWTVDDTPYHSFDKTSDDSNHWPFGNGNQLYVIFNLAMGGTGGGEIQDEHGPWRMEVQNVSYYPLVK